MQGVTYTQRAVASRAEPLGDAVEVEDVPAVPPRDAETVFARGGRVGLVLDARLVQAVAANGAGIRANRPRPHRHSVPLRVRVRNDRATGLVVDERG